MILRDDQVSFTPAIGNDHVLRWNRPLDEPLGPVDARRLDDLLDAWHKRLRHPGIDASDVIETLLATENFGWATLINVSPEDPRRYRSEMWGTSLITNAQFKRHVTVGDLQPLLSQWVQAEYMSCKESGQPVKQEVTWKIGEETRDMYRLLLPLSFGKTVDRLVSAIVYKRGSSVRLAGTGRT